MRGSRAGGTEPRVSTAGGWVGLICRPHSCCTDLDWPLEGPCPATPFRPCFISRAAADAALEPSSYRETADEP